jgi:hypothetical protein
LSVILTILPGILHGNREHRRIVLLFSFPMQAQLPVPSAFSYPSFKKVALSNYSSNLTIWIAAKGVTVKFLDREIKIARLCLV